MGQLAERAIGAVRHVAARFRKWPVQTPAAGPLAGMSVEFPPWLAGLDAAQPYEPDVTAALQRLAGPGFACADLGAHVGYFTLLLAKLSGDGGTVVSFEASPENARIVRRNVKLNDLEGRVTVEQAAVTDHTSEAVQLYAGRSGGSTEWTMDAGFAVREDPDGARAAEGAMVRGVSLDEYFPPGTRLDLIKMDIEGGEAQAVPGMRRLLQDARPIVVLEFHREVGWPAIPVLQDAGYSFETLDGEALADLAGPDDVPYQFVARPPARA